MSFAGWGRRCKLVVQSSQITGDHVNFPVLLTEESLPQEMFDADGNHAALNGGGDIRFSTDKEGNNQIPCEVELFTTDNNPANGKAAIWVKRSILAEADVDIWVFYHKAGESQPARDAANVGSENVWVAGFKAVHHLNQDPSGGANCIIDSTSNDTHGTPGGTMLTEDLVTGVIGKGISFDGTDDQIDMGNLTTGGAGTLSFTIEPNVTINNGLPADGYGLFSDSTYDDDHIIARWTGGSTGALSFYCHDGADWIETISTTTSWTADTAYWVDLVWDGTTQRLYVNGAEEDHDLQGSPADATSGNWKYGRSNEWDTAIHFPGIIDEVEYFAGTRNANSLLVKYNNQHSPGTFVIEGTPETPFITTITIC